ncbi:MAG: DUF429 domain-containing protein [Saprospiraceae bacterium]|nr:DUF429 domain-containing protein [Saprospiraceae bacterium]
MNIIGIDYGSKLAGTTVIAHWNEANDILLYQSEKKKDADKFVLQWVTQNPPEHIYIDAPLSLPGVYRSLHGHNDYFYRKADKELKAMSPMFLGGLTARAMKLCAQIKALHIPVTEVYPSALASLYQLDKSQYKKQKIHLGSIMQAIQSEAGIAFPQIDINNWHQLDAILALFSGIRHQQKKCIHYGIDNEGVIVV